MANLNYKFKGKGLNKAEKKRAKRRFDKYCKAHNYERLNDLELLESLVFQEMLTDRLKDKVEDLGKSEKIKDTDIVPKYILEQIRDLEDQALKIRDKLGLFETKKSDSPLKYLKDLEKKFEKWMQNNKASREVVCIAKNTKILLSDFTEKNIQDCKIGDEILGTVQIDKQGLKLVKQKIKVFYDKGVQEVLKITTKNGRELICTPDHKIFVYYRSQKKRASSQDYISAENTLRRYLKVFNGISNLENYYKGAILGLIKSDGWDRKPKHPKWNFTKSYHICQSHLKEERAVDFLLNYFNIKYSKIFRNRGWGHGAYRYNISTEFTSFIDNIESQLFSDKDLMLGFLAGFILGDGHIDKLGNAFITQKKVIINNLLSQIFESLNLYYTSHKNEKSVLSYSLRKQIPLIIPDSKKCEKFNKLLFSKGQRFNEDFIVKIELIGKQQVYDITTETKNFIANGFIVHNCPFCSELFFLKIRTDMYEAYKSPFFNDKILCNKHLLHLLKMNKITKLDVSKILGVSEDYVTWLLEKLNKNEKL